MKTYPTNRRILIGASMALFAGASSIPGEGAETKQKTKSIDVQFLEIVTLDVEETVALYSKFHGVSFSEPNSVLGGGRQGCKAEWWRHVEHQGGTA